MINMETKNLIVSLGTKPDSIRIADITISLPHQLGIVQIVDWPLLTRVVNTYPSTTTSYVKFRGYAVLVAMTEIVRRPTFDWRRINFCCSRL